MLGDGYETGQVPLFHVFVRIFGLDPAQNMAFSKRQPIKSFDSIMRN